MVSPPDRLGRFHGSRNDVPCILQLTNGTRRLQSNASTATAGGVGVGVGASRTFDAIGSDAAIASPELFAPVPGQKRATASPADDD